MEKNKVLKKLIRKHCRTNNSASFQTEHRFKLKSKKCSGLKFPVKSFQVLLCTVMAKALRVFIGHSFIYCVIVGSGGWGKGGEGNGQGGCGMCSRW